jgi:hypothetical protein
MLTVTPIFMGLSNLTAWGKYHTLATMWAVSIERICNRVGIRTSGHFVVV